MTITLGPRSRETETIYYLKVQQPAIRATLPQKAQSLEEFLTDYEQSLLPGSGSFGRVVYADGQQVGAVWCYCINPQEEPNAMVSFCIFEPQLWGQGIATEALGLFLQEARPRFGLKSVGAFCYRDNAASLRTLEKNRFTLRESFQEEGVWSCYFQWDFD